MKCKKCLQPLNPGDKVCPVCHQPVTPNRTDIMFVLLVIEFVLFCLSLLFLPAIFCGIMLYFLNKRQEIGRIMAMISGIGHVGVGIYFAIKVMKLMLSGVTAVQAGGAMGPAGILGMGISFILFIPVIIIIVWGIILFRYYQKRKEFFTQEKSQI